MARRKLPRKIEENMRAAVELITSGEKIRKAAKLKELSYATLKRYYLKTKNAREGLNVRLVPNYNVNQIFNSEQEEALKKYLKNCAYLLYGLTNKDYRMLAPSTVTDRRQLEEIDPTAVAADNNISIDLEPEKENIAPQEDSSVNESSQTGNKKFIDPTEFRPPFKAKPRKNIRKNRKRVGV
ncbi:hypothetical protein JTB14_011157 [Gonioctena quinquepunctata]|nr:hypothetical protein JTB14_011157 [Gonioctena quinquepunctata]